MDTVTKTELRSAESGPVLSGNAGDVLTFGADGRTVQGAPIPPSSGGVAEASGRVDGVTVDPGVPQNLDIDLGTFPASLNTGTQVWLVGYFLVDVAPGAELAALVGGTYDLQISFDGGISFIQSGAPVPFSALGSMTQNVTLSLPLAWALGGVADLTGNLIARVVASIDNITAGSSATCAAYVQAEVAGPAPTT